MQETRQTIFSTDDNTRKEVSDALRRLLEICQIHNLPMFASVAVANTEESTEYDNITYSPQAHQIRLQDDQIRKHMLVAGGFEAVPPRDAVTFNMQEVFGNG